MPTRECTVPSGQRTQAIDQLAQGRNAGGGEVGEEVVRVQRDLGSAVAPGSPGREPRARLATSWRNLLHDHRIRRRASASRARDSDFVGRPIQQLRAAVSNPHIRRVHRQRRAVLDRCRHFLGELQQPAANARAMSASTRARSPAASRRSPHRHPRSRPGDAGRSTTAIAWADPDRDAPAATAACRRAAVESRPGA